MLYPGSDQVMIRENLIVENRLQGSLASTVGVFVAGADSSVIANTVRGHNNQGVAMIDDDFRLRSGSPAIDAGDPQAHFLGEPAPHGHRINLGAFGGTAQATAGSEHTLHLLTPLGPPGNRPTF